jgi:hypothetical protein
MRQLGFLMLGMMCVAGFSIPGSAQDASGPETHGVVVANIDRSVKPGDDFYLYANGEWIKRTEIPPDRAGVNVFTKLSDISNKRTADLIEEIAKSNPAAGTPTRKVADLFNSYMDEAGIQGVGAAEAASGCDRGHPRQKGVGSGIGRDAARRCGRAQ